MRFRLFLLGLSLFWLSSLWGKATICLNMIVKNEHHVLQRCLDSVLPLIDYWVIVDTGSTDGTQELIRTHLASIPGELHERPWKNFGENRNEALKLAQGKCDYFLFIDADDWLEITAPVPPLEKDVYLLKRGTKDFSFLMPQLVRSSLPWRWVGVVHEYITCDQPTSEALLEEVAYVAGHDGASYHDPQKYLKYIVWLQAALLENPTDTRSTFYLAQSYKDAGDIPNALLYYHKRIALGGWQEEVFWSLLQIAHLTKTSDTESVIQNYYRAHRHSPHRLEPLYYLAELYNRLNRHDLAYATLKSHQFIPLPPHPDHLFQESWITHWGFALQLSVAAYYLGAHQESFDLCNNLLIKDLPPHIRTLVEKNRLFPLQKLKS